MAWEWPEVLAWGLLALGLGVALVLALIGVPPI